MSNQSIRQSIEKVIGDAKSGTSHDVSTLAEGLIYVGAHPESPEQIKLYGFLKTQLQAAINRDASFSTCSLMTTKGTVKYIDEHVATSTKDVAIHESGLNVLQMMSNEFGLGQVHGLGEKLSAAIWFKRQAVEERKLKSSSDFGEIEKVLPSAAIKELVELLPPSV